MLTIRLSLVSYVSDKIYVKYLTYYHFFYNTSIATSTYILYSNRFCINIPIIVAIL